MRTAASSRSDGRILYKELLEKHTEGPQMAPPIITDYDQRYTLNNTTTTAIDYNSNLTTYYQKPQASAPFFRPPVLPLPLPLPLTGCLWGTSLATSLFLSPRSGAPPKGKTRAPCVRAPPPPPCRKPEPTNVPSSVLSFSSGLFVRQPIQEID